MNCLQSWPEPIVRVQALSESGIKSIPERYIKPSLQRPNSVKHGDRDFDDSQINIPLIDLQSIYSNDESVRNETLSCISNACRDWAFFQVVNHGVSPELMKQTREMWREFFNLPLELKQEYANSPTTYEGYGSRLGVEKGAKLDWSDYFFLHFMPHSLRNPNKWPSLPPSCRELVSEYGENLVKLCGVLMKPDLTLGLSPHSDPGGMTLLLPDENVAGLQVRRGDNWITVKPVPNAFIVNIGDQIQVLSNAIYKSVEHRVIVNSEKDRVSLAFFYNPKSDLLIEPMKEFVTRNRPALYPPMTYDEYRLYIRTKGPCGKAQVESLTSSP
ncbi:putative 2-oxoglutarate-dependent dioxygenase [Citrus sinensis]|nr:putative 2-oxoglutarate-dependent dioxygenase [Citrus sinensis]